MGDLEKAVATGLVTLVVGFVLLQAQLGGSRSRQRRELREELALLEQLDAGAYPGVHARLSARVGVLLERYEPAAVRTGGAEAGWPLMLLAALGGISSGTLSHFRPELGSIASTAIVLPAVGLAAVLGGMVRVQLRLRADDAAVIEEIGRKEADSISREKPPPDNRDV